MATPVGDSYAVASGGIIASGRYSMPAWRRAMSPHTWAEVSANTLSSVDPKNSPTYNPNYPADPPWRGVDGQHAIIDAWSTATWDERRGYLDIPIGGGHASYAGNECYRLNLYADSPAWSLLYPPSVVDYTYGGQTQEATGTYTDGRLRSAHTYNNIIYVDGVGHICARIIGMYQSGQVQSNSVWTINESGIATLRNSGATGLAYAYGGVCYDASRHALWGSGVNNGQIFKIDLATWTLTKVGPYSSLGTSYTKPVFIPEFDALCTTENGLILYDAATGTQHLIPLTGTAFPASFLFNGSHGAAWVSGSLWMWNNSAFTEQIYTLTPTGNPFSDPWVRGVAALSGGNTVTPTPKTGNGTYGRFGYSERLKCFYLINSTTSAVYVYAKE